MPPKYEDLSRRELQALAKENGISVRRTSADIVGRLLAMSSALPLAPQGAPLDSEFVDVFMDEDVFKLHHDCPAVVRPVFVLRLGAQRVGIPMDALLHVLDFTQKVLRDSKMTLYVRPLAGKHFELHKVDRTDTIENLKDRIKGKAGLKPTDQRLIFCGKQLEDGRTVEDYGVENNSILHVVMRLRGQGHMGTSSASGAANALLPTRIKIVLQPGNYSDCVRDSLLRIVSVTDFFGSVPFEQRGDVVTTARPVLHPIVCDKNQKIQIDYGMGDTDKYFCGFAVMVTVVGIIVGTSVIGTSKTTRIVVPFPKDQEDPLYVLKQELARSFDISPLQCSLRLQLQSTKFIPLTTARDLVHPAATRYVELTVLPFVVKGAEAAVETRPVMHSKLGMVCVVSVRGIRLVGKRILKGHVVATEISGSGGVVGVLYNEEEPWFSLYELDEEDFA